MALDSPHFILFVLAAAAAIYALPHRFYWIVLVICSYVFYGYWGLQYIPVLLFCTISTFSTALILEKSQSQRSRNRVLWAGLTLLLTPLVAFKYLPDLSLTVSSHSLQHLIIPLGLSFYSFKLAGYLIDVSRKRLPAERHFGHFAAFASFFPLLAAGPIERGTSLLPQIKKRAAFEWSSFREGGFLIFKGLFKKSVFADLLALPIAHAFTNSSHYHGLTLFFVLVLARYHLYCDFSGYTDIARGAARILGVEVVPNFRRPFLAKDIAEFWRRWHMSLSSWMRDYVFMPMVVSPIGRTFGPYLPLFLSFVILGLWHGASETFLLFGVIQGALVVGHDLSRNWRSKIVARCGFDKSTSRRIAYAVFQRLFTFVAYVCLPFVLFKSLSLSEAGAYYKNLFILSSVGLGDSFRFFFDPLGNKATPLLVGLVMMELMHIYEEWRESRGGRLVDLKTFLFSLPLFLRWTVYTLLVFIFLALGNFSDQINFTYFAF